MVSGLFQRYPNLTSYFTFLFFFFSFPRFCLILGQKKAIFETLLEMRLTAFDSEPRRLLSESGFL